MRSGELECAKSRKKALASSSRPTGVRVQRLQLHSAGADAVTELLLITFAIIVIVVLMAYWHDPIVEAFEPHRQAIVDYPGCKPADCATEGAYADEPA